MSRIRNYFLTAHGWKPIAISVSLVVVMVALVSMSSKAGADERMHRPDTPGQFVSHFKAGDYGHARRHVRYSPEFKAMWRHLYVRAYNRHNRTDCTDVGTCSTVAHDGWVGFVHTDTCGVNVGDDMSSLLCTLSHGAQYNIAHLVDSPYWTRRGEEQNKWEARLVWCGGIGIATFFTGGTAAAAIGPGATGCLGAFFLG